MRRFRTLFWASACVAALAATPLPALCASVTVFAAASLKEALDEQAKAFEARSGDKVIVSYAASNALAKQIEAGAGADVFISADLDWMNYVEERKLVAPGSRIILLHNTLVLVAPASSKSALRIAPGFDLAGALGNDRLAMANPDSVPAGKYGKAALERLGVWAAVDKRVARTENVRVALALVARGEAPFGIVYRTDALADPGVRIVDAFPANAYPLITYPAALVATSRSPAAKPLLDWLRSDAARAAWEKHGFSVPQ